MTEAKKDAESVEVAPGAGVPRGELASTEAANARAEAAKKDKGDAGPVFTEVRRSTGQRRAAAQSHDEKYEMVKVEYLKRDYGFDGVVYGPGSNLMIPEPLAAQLGLTGKRKSQAMTRQEEHEAGLTKPAKGESLVIPLSDITHEGPSQAEIEAANERQGTTTEQLEERRAQAEDDAPPRARAASAPKGK